MTKSRKVYFLVWKKKWHEEIAQGRLLFVLKKKWGGQIAQGRLIFILKNGLKKLLRNCRIYFEC